MIDPHKQNDTKDFDFTEDDYNEDMPYIDNCPKCGTEWDDINNEYMHCHICHWDEENKKFTE